MSTHPAVQASINSAKYAMAQDREAWLALFSEDAHLEDPVGPSPLDPEGAGYDGREGLERFWDKAVAGRDLTIEASQRIPCAHACAAVLHVTSRLPDGRATEVDMVGVYEVDEAGKIAQLKVYWSFPALAAQLKALGVL